MERQMARAKDRFTQGAQSGARYWSLHTERAIGGLQFSIYPGIRTSKHWKSLFWGWLLGKSYGSRGPTPRLAGVPWSQYPGVEQSL